MQVKVIIVVVEINVEKMQILIRLKHILIILKTLFLTGKILHAELFRCSGKGNVIILGLQILLVLVGPVLLQQRTTEFQLLWNRSRQRSVPDFS